MELHPSENAPARVRLQHRPVLRRLRCTRRHAGRRAHLRRV